MEITYSKHVNYYLPDLLVPEEKFYGKILFYRSVWPTPVGVP